MLKSRGAKTLGPDVEGFRVSQIVERFGVDKDAAKAIDGLSTIILHSPNSPYAYTGIGLIHSQSGNDHLAEALYKKSISVSPTAEAYYRLGLTYKSGGKFKDAITQLSLALERDPRFADCYHARGFAFSSLGDVDAALSDYVLGNRLKPNAISLEDSGFLRYHSKGDIAGALRDLELAVSVSPTFLLAYDTLADTFNHAGNLERERSIRARIARMNVRLNVLDLEIRGQARKETGDLSGALEDFSLAIDCCRAQGGSSMQSAIYEGRADAYYASGNYFQGSLDFVRSKVRQMFGN